jgi:hypothetical protein
MRLQQIPRTAVDHEVRRGQLARVFPRAYVRPWDVDQVEQLERAAFLSVGAPVALSHLTALRRWGVIDSPDSVHVTVPYGRRARPRPEWVVHRARTFPRVIGIDGFATVDLPDALVTSWGLLAPHERRRPVIAAIRDRLTTPASVADALLRYPKVTGRRDIALLAQLLSDGCESELEIWGFRKVFDHPGLRHGTRQLEIRTRSGGYRIDLAFEDEKVAVEMDGESFHSTRDQRETDRRRDAALAALGWLTLRFSYRRLHDDINGCRRDTLAALAVRRGS